MTQLSNLVCEELEGMIQVERLCKAYDRSIAVRDLSFTVASGQILGLVGPNGAGKTTTMRAIAGIIPLSGGTVRVAGFDLNDSPLAVKHCTAYVPDDPQLFHELTVEQHMAFIASLYDVKGAEEKISALLTAFELNEKRHATAAELSRGMRQKLAICCAYLYEPRALLLDEPMTGLDPPGIRRLKSSIVERAESGSAVIISSHLLAMVEDICTHVLILNQGQERFSGRFGQLQETFGEAGRNISLEEIFFRAIDADQSTLANGAAQRSTDSTLSTQAAVQA